MNKIISFLREGLDDAFHSISLVLEAVPNAHETFSTDAFLESLRDAPLITKPVQCLTPMELSASGSPLQPKQLRMDMSSDENENAPKARKSEACKKNKKKKELSLV